MTLLEKLETDRTPSPTLTDMTYIALHTIGQLATPATSNGPLNIRFLEAAEAACLARPASHLMAAVLAMIHIKLGWHWRGSGMAGEISPAHEKKFFGHFERAAQLLEPFDPILLDAPSIAIARYNLFAAHPDAADNINDWFYDWVDLSPDSVSPFEEHGFQLLPRWFGEDESALDREGLQAVAATRERLGSAAYALLYMSAMQDGCDEGVLGYLDVPLFYEGLDDLMVRCTDPRRSNSMTKALYDVAFSINMFDAVTSSEDRDEAALAHLRLGFGPFVRRHVEMLIPQKWQNEDEARCVVAQAYRDQLQAGAVIRVENGEIVIDLPDDTDATSS